MSEAALLSTVAAAEPSFGVEEGDVPPMAAELPPLGEDAVRLVSLMRRRDDLVRGERKLAARIRRLETLQRRTADDMRLSDNATHLFDGVPVRIDAGTFRIGGGSIRGGGAIGARGCGGAFHCGRGFERWPACNNPGAFGLRLTNPASGHFGERFRGFWSSHALAVLCGFEWVVWGVDCPDYGVVPAFHPSPSDSAHERLERLLEHQAILALHAEPDDAILADIERRLLAQADFPKTAAAMDTRIRKARAYAAIRLGHRFRSAGA